jgi:hypothetical protein
LVATSCSGESSREPVVEIASALSAKIVIAEVYGGGGNNSALYTHDFVVLFNRGSAAASLNGLYLQYASAGSAFSYDADA